MRRFVIIVGLQILFLWQLSAVGQTSEGDTVSLSDLIQEAVENNPDLQSAKNNWHADKAKIPQAGALPDPVFSFKLANMPINSFDFNQEPMTGKQVSVMQMFPFPGKLGLRADIATENAMVSEQKYKERRNQLVKTVKDAYYHLFFIDQAIAIIQKNQEKLQQFVRIAETKYEVGEGLQQDVLKAQVALSKHYP